MHGGPWRKQACCPLSQTRTGLGERKSASQQPELLHQVMGWPVGVATGSQEWPLFRTASRQPHPGRLYCVSFAGKEEEAGPRQFRDELRGHMVGLAGRELEPGYI